MSEPRSEDAPPAEDWHERDCGIAGGWPHAASEHDLPPMKVVHVIESHRCEHCGAVCPSCLRTDEGTKDACICPRFRDTGGYRIADLCCPVHGVNGTDPGDGYWPAEAAPSGSSGGSDV